MKQIIDCGISEYVTHRIKQNDIKWGITLILSYVIFIGFYCQRDYKREQTLRDFEFKHLVKCEQFKDSLINYCKNEYVWLK